MTPRARSSSAASTSAARSRSGSCSLECAVGGRLDLRVGHGRQPELGEDRLHRPRGPPSDAQSLVLGDRLDAAVDLPVALDREPLVDVVGVVVPPAEGVVCARHDRVAGGDEVGPRRNWPISFAVFRIGEWEAMASFPDATSRSSQAASTFSARIARVPPGTDEDERDARDRPVLDALRSRGAHDRDAARLEVEHR